MKAVQIFEKGDSSVLKFSENLPDPVPGDNDVLVENHYAGINFIDIYFREGVYPAASYPYIPGKEAAGVVLEVGKNVTRFKKGDRVGYPFAPTGSYCGLSAVPENSLVSIPESVPLDQGTAVMLQGLTAHYLAYSVADLKPGDKALVHAAAGGVGLLLTQIAKEKGAVVYGTVSTEEKKKLALDAGADEVILYDNHQFAEKLLDVTGGEKMDVVYDSVGQATFDQSLSVIRPRGIMALYGQSSGVVPSFDLNRLNTSGSLLITRPSLGAFIATVEELESRAADLYSLMEKGKLNVRIGKTYALEKAAEAQDDLEGRRSTGKLLLKI